ncbi:glycosyltransferase family 92 protein [Kordiimonas sp. SCSIO 12603]|uniref:glycosyltransferase family 92 protein n=1 Tax=Kordiimonas sp. SCSIO 12603 TaxID=2829596 RepID=UPI00210834EA|nr:glycosyltransferase family 92 protein [Kordiimonas sp. SCSIO 12603]UTW59263.1 glycosyltransferase family 92 protein [Kordiimonas sp. SCSIO 12603]
MLDGISEPLRHAPIPESYVDGNFKKNFDSHTLFYDGYYTRQDQILLHGPNFMNLENEITETSLICPSTRQIIQFEKQTHQKKCSLISFKPINKQDAYIFQLKSGSKFLIKPNANEHDAFKNKNVLLTMIKFDNLQWIKNWVEFYVKSHKVNALILYNNNAPNYSGEDILSILSDIKGLQTVRVIDWFFPYGPRLADNWTGRLAFCQINALQHARWRYLEKANTVINADVDELIVCEDNIAIPDLLDQTSQKYLEFTGVWTIKEGGTDFSIPEENRHYSNYFYSQIHKLPTKKWALKPSMCKDAHLWHIHRIPGMKNDVNLSNLVEYRHFPEFNSGWKTFRTRRPNSFRKDHTLCNQYKKIGWA